MLSVLNHDCEHIEVWLAVVGDENAFQAYLSLIKLNQNDQRAAWVRVLASSDNIISYYVLDCVSRMALYRCRWKLWALALGLLQAGTHFQITAY